MPESGFAVSEDEFGSDLITISDEEGNDYTLEHVDTVEIDDKLYMACLTADLDEDDDDYGLVILEIVGDGELATVDDEELLESLYDLFMERLFEDSDEEIDDEA